MKHWLFSLFLLTLSSLCFGDDSIVVHLNASIPLYKTYLAASQLDAKLKEVLAYDLEHNGYCQLVSNKSDAVIVITAAEANQKVLLTVEQGKHTFQTSIPLSQKLPEDRMALHRAHDALCEKLFGTKGIASHRILYTSRKKEGSDSAKWSGEVWFSDYDGANPKQLTQEHALVVTPTLLPCPILDNVPYFLYVSYKEGEPKIFLGGKGQSKRVTYMLGNQFMPALSKQCDLIAFISTIHGKEDLFIQSFSLEKGVMGSAKKLFSAPKATQGTPTFHPNGKEIAFVSNKDGTPRIYTMRIPRNGESPKDCPLRLLSKKNRENTSPHWSPDGNKIAYSALTRGVRQIWIYDMKKNEEMQLTFGESHCENPVWAADSLHLLYNSASYENSELYMIDCNQKRPTKIAMGPKDKRFPAWEG